jgi:tRNA dimethylallyltransferase
MSETSDHRFADCWFLTGATATGKTRVGIALAQRLGAEIISLDSMAIYRGMDIGTAKPTAEDRAAVPHHLVDIVEPADEYSVAQYVEAAAATVAEIRTRGREVLFVGGTPLYLKSLLRGLFDGPPANWEVRQEIEDELATVGQAALHERLTQIDPVAASNIHPHDTRRLIRALEVFRATGEPLSHQQTEFEEGRAAEAVGVASANRGSSRGDDRCRARGGSGTIDGRRPATGAHRESGGRVSRGAGVFGG